MSMENVHITDSKRVKRAARVLRVLGHPIRFAIVDLLETGTFAVKEIQANIPLDAIQPIISQQLKILSENGVVRCKKKGTFCYYSLSPNFPVGILGCVRQCKALK